MNDITSTKEQLISAHQDIASSSRAALKFLTQLVVDNTCNEQKFFELVKHSSNASLMLKRINSTLSDLIKVEQNLIDLKMEINTGDNKSNHITRQDCEIVISLVRRWGLLRDDCDEEIESIIEEYESDDGDL